MGNDDVASVYKPAEQLFKAGEKLKFLVHHAQIIDWKRFVRHKSLWRTERLGLQTNRRC